MPRHEIKTKSKISIMLKKIMRKHNLNQKELAAIAKVQPSVFCAWVYGAFPAESVEKIKKLSNKFGYTLSEALTGSKDLIKNKKKDGNK